jgi:hypothetical protein
MNRQKMIEAIVADIDYPEPSIFENEKPEMREVLAEMSTEEIKVEYDLRFS